MKKNVLVIGQGGREHAIAWKISRSPLVEKVYVCPGNGGTALDASLENININLQDSNELIKFAKEKEIDLTIIGPEGPLSDGIVNDFLDAKLNIFGPTKEFAILESSKVFSKEFMENYNIPTAKYRMFSNPDEAKKYCLNRNHPLVIKADGLAAGKGVVVSSSLTETNQAIDAQLSSNHSNHIVVEEFLKGQELSAIYIANYQGCSHEIGLHWTKDYKSRDEYNTGPNTGGMGAVSHPLCYEHKNSVFKLHLDIEKIMVQTITGINEYNKHKKIGYLGFLYLGLMINNNNEIKVLEYNCRLGDPETQNLMLTLHNNDTDLMELILDNSKSIKDFNLSRIDDDNNNFCCTIVLAAKGYPGDYKKGFYIDISKINQNDQLIIFHAGTTIENGKLMSIGGRILTVNAYAEDKEDAIKIAYDNIEKINIYEDEGYEIKNQNLVFYRDDIGN